MKKYVVIFSAVIALISLNSCNSGYESEYDEWNCEEYDCTDVPGGQNQTHTIATATSPMTFDGNFDVNYFDILNDPADDIHAQPATDIQNTGLIQDSTHLWICINFCDGVPEDNPTFTTNYSFLFRGVNGGLLYGIISIDYNGSWALNTGSPFSSVEYARANGIEIKIPKAQLPQYFSLGINSSVIDGVAYADFTDQYNLKLY